jgi:hypothetical protein
LFTGILFICFWLVATVGLSLFLSRAIPALVLRLRRKAPVESVAPPSVAAPPAVPNPCETLHDMTVIGAQHISGFPHPTTAVLFRCARCGVHWTAGFLGSWTLEDFLRRESEIAELERIAK